MYSRYNTSSNIKLATMEITNSTSLYLMSLGLHQLYGIRYLERYSLDQE